MKVLLNIKVWRCAASGRLRLPSAIRREWEAFFQLRSAPSSEGATSAVLDIARVVKALRRARGRGDLLHLHFQRPRQRPYHFQRLYGGEVGEWEKKEHHNLFLIRVWLRLLVFDWKKAFEDLKVRLVEHDVLVEGQELGAQQYPALLCSAALRSRVVSFGFVCPRRDIGGGRRWISCN